MTLMSASGFVIFLLSVTVARVQSQWGVTYTSTDICAVQGSSVNISCTYTYPPSKNGQNTTVTKTLWFTRLDNNKNAVNLKEESDSADRVQYVCVENRCSVRISDLRQNDSADYCFRFITNQPGGRFTGSPGVTLTVTDLQVHVSSASPCIDDTCIQAELRCQGTCRLPDQYQYIWFKNGKRIQRHTSSSCLIYMYSRDTVSCAVKGYEKFSSPSVFAPRVPSVSFSPSGEITEGSSVTLTCSSDANPPVTKYTWYKRGNYQPESRGQQFVLSFINSSDSGSYSCVVENSLGLKMSEYVYIDVTYPPRLPSVSVSPSGHTYQGSSVTLTCTSDANPPVTKYTWYKEDEDSPKASGQIFTITDFRSEHSGYYYCEAQSSRGRQNSTSHLITVSVETMFIVNIVKLSLLVLLLSSLIFTTLCFRKKKIQHLNPEMTPLEPIELDPFPIYENVSIARKTAT